MVEKNIMKPRAMRDMRPREVKEFDERVIEVQRVSRVVKGGRRVRFRALVVAGDHNGRIGMGIAKAAEVAEAVRKATVQAKKHIVSVPVINGTIPHEIRVKYGSARLLLMPAAPGTTIVAGGSVRTVAELAGITDMLGKIMGSSNKINNVSATIRALSSFLPSVVDKIRGYSAHPEIQKVAKAAADGPKTDVRKNIEEKEKPKPAAKEVKKETAVKKEQDFKLGENSETSINQI